MQIRSLGICLPLAAIIACKGGETMSPGPKSQGEPAFSLTIHEDGSATGGAGALSQLPPDVRDRLRELQGNPEWQDRLRRFQALVQAPPPPSAIAMAALPGGAVAQVMRHGSQPLIVFNQHALTDAVIMTAHHVWLNDALAVPEPDGDRIISLYADGRYVIEYRGEIFERRLDYNVSSATDTHRAADLLARAATAPEVHIDRVGGVRIIP